MDEDRRVAEIAAPPVSFTVIDEADPREISEATVLRVNGDLAGSFRLDGDHRLVARTASVPAAAAYEYTLCGSIVLRTPEGGTETHAVDDGGVLMSPSGRIYEMLAAGDFTRFYLQEGKGAVTLGARRQGCPRNIASK